MECSIDRNSNKTVDMITHSKDNSVENVHDGNEQEQQPKHSAKSFVFGPFSPVGVLRVGNRNEKQPKDWENLASTFRPQYHNQGIFVDFILNRLMTCPFWST